MNETKPPFFMALKNNISRSQSRMHNGVNVVSNKETSDRTQAVSFTPNQTAVFTGSLGVNPRFVTYILFKYDSNHNKSASNDRPLPS